MFVSEAVRAETGKPLPMTQTLDQMVRTAAKAGVSLHFSTDSQADAVQLIHGTVLQLKTESEALRKDAERYRWLRDGAGYCDTRDIPGMAPARMDAFIDAAMAKERAR
ncbi:hypothetical protein [Pseudomonas sp.]|uniref:hypothetical protein n=1 Tax=Pseudomonas sp. TaxID=306 RepID=UPI00289ADA2A|nr:hypothetical protein [Pseudomonas sp.]